MEIVDNKCPSCGSSIEYNIKEKCLTCSSCDSKFDKNDIFSSDFIERIAFTNTRCPNCSAELFFYKNDLSTKCVYCGSDVVVNKTEDKYPMPKKLIPFEIAEDEVEKIFLDSLKNKNLIPSSFKKTYKITSLKGIYIPFWLYNVAYSVSVSSVGSSFNNTITNSRNVKNVKTTVLFENVPYDANRHLSDSLSNGIEPFDTSKIVNFNPAYLSGFTAQKYDVSENEGKKLIDERCKNSINHIFMDITSPNYLEGIGIFNKTKTDEKIEYALLPVWSLKIKYKGKLYEYLINGQTGKMTGKYPINDSRLNVMTIGLLGLFMTIYYFLFKWLIKIIPGISLVKANKFGIILIYLIVVLGSLLFTVKKIKKSYFVRKIDDANNYFEKEKLEYKIK